jgi:hypothetical protein
MRRSLNKKKHIWEILQSEPFPVTLTKKIVENTFQCHHKLKTGAETVLEI